MHYIHVHVFLLAPYLYRGFATKLLFLTAAPSAPPLSPQHNVESSTRLTLMWSAPSLQYINGVIRHYSIQLNDTTGIRTTTGTSYTIHNLHPYYIYQYRVAAFTVRLGPYSQWQSVRMLQARELGHYIDDTYFICFSLAGPSGSPQNVRVTQRQLTSITLEWQPPLSYQQNGIITTYTVQITQLGESLSTVTTTGLRITISSLLPNSLYSFMVAASTAVGRGPYTSPSLNVRTLSPGMYRYS